MVTNPLLRWLGILCALGTAALLLTVAVMSGYDHSHGMGAGFVICAIFLTCVSLLVGVGAWPRIKVMQEAAWLFGTVLSLVVAGLTAAALDGPLAGFYAGSPGLGWATFALSLGFVLVYAAILGGRGRAALPYPSESVAIREATRPEASHTGGG